MDEWIGWMDGWMDGYFNCEDQFRGRLPLLCYVLQIFLFRFVISRKCHTSITQ